MRFATLVALLLILQAAGPARAEVTRKSPAAFKVVHKATSKAPAADVFRALGQVDRWWNSRHTFSGKSESLSLKTEAGGCFCEKWAEGSVEHGRVLQTMKDRLLRLQSALGPALELPVNGVLTFSLEPKGTGSELTVSYWLSGDPSLAAGKWAGPSDIVIGDQTGRLIRFVETGKPEP